MKCNIDNCIVDCKVVENLGYQGGMYAKVVLYNGIERVVVKTGGMWVNHKPIVQPMGHYTGQSNV